MGYFLFDHLVTLYMIQNVEIKNLYKTGQAPWTILKALFVQKMSKHLFVKNVTAGSSTLHSVDSSLNLAKAIPFYEKIAYVEEGAKSTILIAS